MEELRESLSSLIFIRFQTLPTLVFASPLTSDSSECAPEQANSADNVEAVLLSPKIDSEEDSSEDGTGSCISQESGRSVEDAGVRKACMLCLELSIASKAVLYVGWAR